MTPTVQEIINIIQKIAPESLAESWDNVGLLAGDPQQKAKKVLLALDPTANLIHQAVTLNCDLIITHHPAIFRPLASIVSTTPTGFFIIRALQNNIAVIGCHTNFDSTIGGVSDVLAENLDLQDIRPLIAGANGENESTGLGRIGSYPTPISSEDLITKIINTCKPPWLLEAGTRPDNVSSVAVCGGSCGDFARQALAQGAQVLLTSEIKHDVARWAEDAGLWIIDGGHFATENPAIKVLQKYLQAEAEQNNYSVEILMGQQHPPLKLIQESIQKTTTLQVG